MSIDSILDSVYNGFINLFTNLLYGFLTPIVNQLWNSFPNTSTYIGYVHQFFFTITRFVLYIVDLSMLYQPVLAFLIGSIIYRITFNQIVNVIKIIIKWWHYIVP